MLRWGIEAPGAQGSGSTRVLRWTGIAVLAVAGLGYPAFQTSPWLGALLIHRAFRKAGEELSAALVKHVPRGGSARS